MAYLTKKKADFHTISSITHYHGNQAFDTKTINDTFWNLNENLYKSELQADTLEVMDIFFLFTLSANYQMIRKLLSILLYLRRRYYMLLKGCNLGKLLDLTVSAVSSTKSFKTF